jgi:hypothetical protein
MSEQCDLLHQYVLTYEVQCGSFVKDHLIDDDQADRNMWQDF